MPACPCAVLSWPSSSPRSSEATPARDLQEPQAAWDQETLTNTDMLVLSHLHAAKAGNLIPDRAVMASAGARLPTRATTRAKSSSSQQYKDMDQRMVTTALLERLRSMKSHTKTEAYKIRNLLRYLGDYGVPAQVL